MAATESDDAVDRERWLQCVASHKAATDYFDLLQREGYIHE